MAGIAAFVKNHDIAFQSYFDPNDDGILPLASGSPNTLSAYIVGFGS